MEFRRETAQSDAWALASFLPLRERKCGVGWHLIRLS
jgi:hypothetical protein